MSITLKNFILDSLGAIMPVSIEVEILPGFPDFKIIGIPSQNTFSHKERLRFSIKNSGYKYSHARQIVSFTPRVEKCDSEHLDLAIAVAALSRTRQIKIEDHQVILLGKLGLDGTLHTTNTLKFILPKLDVKNCHKIILPAEFQKDTLYKSNPNIVFCKNLVEVVKFLSTKSLPIMSSNPQDLNITHPSFENIIGLKYIKKALVLAVARHHKLLIIGFPGIGKTMLTKSINNFCNSVIEVLPVSPKSTFVKSNLHQNIFTLNPNSVIVINEISELKSDCIEILRYLMDQPNQCSLVATMNPCRCGYFGHTTIPCKCSPQSLQFFSKKLPRPFLDRFDIVINLNTEPEIFENNNDQNFGQTRDALQFNEFIKTLNQNFTTESLVLKLTPSAKTLLHELILKYSLSHRRTFKLLDFAYSLAAYNAFKVGVGKEFLIENSNLIESLAYQSYVIPKIKDSMQPITR